jgi:phosphatidylserine/phosphatidylglycerophosphate/cardiolipin synthase-like enzyme
VAYYHSHGELLHAKAMVVDGERLIVGSANWSRSGFTRNHELDAEFSSPSLAQTALAAMEADWRASL